MLHNADFKELLKPIIRDYRKRSYNYWCARIGADPIVFGGRAPGGDEYFVEIEAFWDDQTNRHIRVGFVIDDGQVTFINGVAVQSPYSEDFIVEPEWQSIGE